MRTSATLTTSGDHSTPRVNNHDPQLLSHCGVKGRIRRTTAIDILQPVGGSTGARLVRASDGRLYVVKSARSVYGPRIPVNEYLAARLAFELALPTPEIALVAVPARSELPAQLCFGSRFICNQDGDAALTSLPACLWRFVENPKDLWGAYVFDVWTGNTDSRQVVFAHTSGPRPLRLFLVDQGNCFAGRLWRMVDCSWSCASHMAFAYADISGLSDLDRWISRAEQLSPDRIREAADGIPPNWLGDGDAEALDTLLEQIIARRSKVRALVAGAIARRDYPFTGCRLRRTPGAVPGAIAEARIA